MILKVLIPTLYHILHPFLTILQEVVHLSLYEAHAMGLIASLSIGWENFFSLRIFPLNKSFAPNLLWVSFVWLLDSQ
jgi:hypothetical protein